MKKLPLPKPQWQHFVLLLTCLLSTSNICAQYYDFQSDNDGKTIYYRIDGFNVSVVSGDIKYAGDINIPQVVNHNGTNFQVTTIGENAFNGCSTLTSVGLPSTITTIESSSFYGCSALSTVNMPNSVNSIGEKAFMMCESIVSLILSNSLKELSEYVFYGCRSLQNINIPESVNTIGAHAFEHCDLKSVIIPSSVTFIGADAFCWNYHIETVTLPNSLSFIGSGAFSLSFDITTINSKIQTPFPIDDVFYSSVKEKATLYVPKGTKSAYQSTTGWNFANIVETNDGDNNGDGNSQISLVVWAKDGSKVAFALSQRPKVTFTETNLIITGEDIDANYPLDKMARFTYEMVDMTAIKDINTEKDAFRFTGESLLFPALKENSTVAVYSLNGALVFKKTVLEAGEYSFPISNLNTGVYLVSVNGLTYKIVKR